MPISQFEAQSGHCFLEEVSQSSKLSVSPMSVINFFDLSLNVLSLFGLIQDLQEKLLVRVILELLNQPFDCFLAIRVLLVDCRMRYAWYSVVDVAAAGFPRNFPMRFGGLRIFLLIDQGDPVVHFANSASEKLEATLETEKLCGKAPP